MCMCVCVCVFSYLTGNYRKSASTSSPVKNWITELEHLSLHRTLFQGKQNKVHSLIQPSVWTYPCDPLKRIFLSAFSKASVILQSTKTGYVWGAKVSATCTTLDKTRQHKHDFYADDTVTSNATAKTFQSLPNPPFPVKCCFRRLAVHKKLFLDGKKKHWDRERMG